MMLALALLLPGTLLAAGSAPVCPGPAGPGSARCHAHVVTDGRGQPNATTSPTGYGPAQFHGAYQLPATTATVQTIAIVDAFDDPNIESDLAVYNSTFGLPPCTTANGCFLKVNQNGSASGPFPRTNSGWALEISLDVEIAHAICQNCKIILVEADSNSFANLSAAVDMAFNSLAHTVLVQNSRTLEDLVREMLKPMLKAWLDDNLPNMVERLVRAEIERVSRGRG